MTEIGVRYVSVSATYVGCRIPWGFRGIVVSFGRPRVTLCILFHKVKRRLVLLLSYYRRVTTHLSFRAYPTRQRTIGHTHVQTGIADV